MIFCRACLAFVKYTHMIGRDREREQWYYDISIPAAKENTKKNYHKKVCPIDQCLKPSKILGDHFPSKFYNFIPPPEYYWLLKTDKCCKPLHLSASVQVYY